MTLMDAIWALSQVRRDENTRSQLRDFVRRSGRCAAYRCNDCLFNVGNAPCLTYGWNNSDVLWAARLLLRRYEHA